MSVHSKQGGGLQTNELASDKTVVINETVSSFLTGEYPHKTIPSYSTLETYDKTHIFIHVEIMEDLVGLFARKLSGGLGPGGTYLEDLQRWILKFGEDSKRLCSSVETFVNWIDNNSTPWAAYCAFMSFCLTVTEKQPDVRPFGVGET